MSLPFIHGAGVTRTLAQLEALQARLPVLPQTPPSIANQGSRPEPAWHPQIQPAAPMAPPVCSPANQAYGPGGFSGYVAGQQARELDVSFMEMAYATYENGPESVCGWTAVSQDELLEAGWDPAVRLDVPSSQFKAEVFTDGQGNYVLAYRGTQDGAADWQTNFEQGLGLETSSGEFELLAPQVAQEFKATFGETGVDADGNPAVTNLAITGHSQGGGLATVGSLLTGIPAVTFDPSGVHPDTLDRLGIDIADARAQAEDGQIRRYSMFEDALTQLQEGIPGISLLAPDALGHHIVLKPDGPLDQGMIDRALEHPSAPDWLTPEIANLPGVRNLVRAVISHDQQLMLDTMAQQQPWQPGWENPEPGVFRKLDDLVPQSVQDEYARNVGELARDIKEVIATDFAQGDYVRGGISILGSAADGFLNSAGATVDGYGDELAGAIERASIGAAERLDTAGDRAGETLDAAGAAIDARADQLADAVSRGSETLAERIRDSGTGPASGVVASIVEGSGGAVSTAFDRGGDLVEGIANTAGAGLDQALDFAGDRVRDLGNGLSWVADRGGDLFQGATALAGRGVEQAADFIGDRAQDVADGLSWLNSKMPWSR